MALHGDRSYVGFGFGAIQAGLFLYEAFQADSFRRLVVAEVVPEVVQTVRQAGGYFSVNIAQQDRIEQATIGPIEILNPALAADRRHLLQAVAEADEIGTAIPSVHYYVSDGPPSLHRTLAEGLRRKASRGGPPAVIYTAENHNHAADILESSVMAEIPAEEQQAVKTRVQFLNTVIGKMSGVITDPAEIQSSELASITAGEHRAVLVEAFNRILISKIQVDPTFHRGISVFEEKDDLLPFEEAKLYGHNATHSLAAYIGAVRGVERISDLQTIPGALSFLRNAFIEESGRALIKKYNGLDPLFTAAGYRAYADDLMDRMVNPYLLDTVERVGRDPERKLGWDDRLIGTMRLALSQGLQPRRYALGAAAALATIPDRDNAGAEFLTTLWRQASPDQQEQAVVLNLIDNAHHRLEAWLRAGTPALEGLL